MREAATWLEHYRQFWETQFDPWTPTCKLHQKRSTTLMIPSASHNNTTLVLRRTFTASRQRVFRAWITPQALEHWFRPGGMSVTVSSLDARVGGSFHFELENGSSMVGTYLHIVPPEKLVFTWSGGTTQGQRTVVTLDFLDHGAVTEVVLTHEGLNTEAMRARVEAGWPSMFDALASVLSSPISTLDTLFRLRLHRARSRQTRLVCWQGAPLTVFSLSCILNQ
jgi:uncharacterized protein YndB with AHSA1/START domain